MLHILFLSPYTDRRKLRVQLVTSEILKLPLQIHNQLKLCPVAEALIGVVPDVCFLIVPLLSWLYVRGFRFANSFSIASNS